MKNFFPNLPGPWTKVQKKYENAKEKKSIYKYIYIERI